MKGLASSLTKKQRVPTIERALMSFWMMLEWISFCLSQRTSCYAVVKRIAYLKRAAGFERSSSSEQEPGALAESLLQHYPPAFSSPWLVSQKEKLVPDLCWQTWVYFCTWLWHGGTLFCSLRTKILWCTSGHCHGETSICRASYSGRGGLGPTVACSLIHTPGNHYKPWAMFSVWQPSGLFYCSTE